MAEAKSISIAYGEQVYQISAKLREPHDRMIVFIHGWGCVKESFDGAFDDKTLRQYGICMFDLLGYGQSDKPDGFSYTLENHAAITTALIEQLQPEKLILVGHSMGGAVAVLSAAGLGDRMCMLVSAEGNLIADDAGKEGSTVRKIAEQSFREFESEGFAKFKAGLARASDHGMQEWSKWCEQASAEAFYKDGQSLVEWSDNGRLLEIFNALDRQVYMVGAESRNKAETIAVVEPNLVIQIPLSKHFMMLDNPAEFYGAIARLAEHNF